MNKIVLVLIIVLAVLAAILLIRLWTPEDDWICQNGQWVKHGNPSASMPTTECR